MIGVPYDLIMESAPADLECYDIAHKMWYREQNEIAYLHGRYVLEAIASSFDKDYKYPKKPYDLNDGLIEEDEEANERLAVAEMQQYIIALEKEGAKPKTKIAR